MGGDPTPPKHTTNKQTKQSGGGADPQTGSTPPPFKETVGSALLSHNPPVAVPSAQKGLTSRFGKDTGCNPLAKTTNTTKTSNTPKKGGDHSPVSETIYPHVPTQPTNPQKRGARQGRVGREPHSGRKHHQKQELLLVIGQLVLVSWSPYNVYTPSLSTR